MPRVRSATTAAVSDGAASASERWATVMGMGACVAAPPPLSRLAPLFAASRAGGSVT